MAPDRGLAGRAAVDDVRPAAVGRDWDPDRRPRKDLDPRRLDQRVDDEGAAGLPLAVRGSGSSGRTSAARRAGTASRRRRSRRSRETAIARSLLPPRAWRGGGSGASAGGQIEKLTPQPQEATALGFLTLNAWPIRSSTKSSSDAAHHLERDGIDDDADPVARRDEIVVGARSASIVEGVLEARAAAALDRNAQRRARLGGEHLLQAARRGGADRQRRAVSAAAAASLMASFRGRQSAGRSL